MTTNYLVYRHGSNKANQSMCDKMPICIVKAKNRMQARVIAEQYHTVYNNQYLSAVPKSKASIVDWQKVVETAQLTNNNNYYLTAF